MPRFSLRLGVETVLSRDLNRGLVTFKLSLQHSHLFVYSIRFFGTWFPSQALRTSNLFIAREEKKQERRTNLRSQPQSYSPHPSRAPIPVPILPTPHPVDVTGSWPNPLPGSQLTASTTGANGGGRGAEGAGRRGGSAGFRTTAAKIPSGRSCLSASVGGCLARSGTLRLYVSALQAREGTRGAGSLGVGMSGSRREHLREPRQERAWHGRRGTEREAAEISVLDLGRQSGRSHQGRVGVTECVPHDHRPPQTRFLLFTGEMVLSH